MCLLRCMLLIFLCALIKVILHKTSRVLLVCFQSSVGSEGSFPSHYHNLWQRTYACSFFLCHGASECVHLWLILHSDQSNYVYKLVLILSCNLVLKLKKKMFSEKVKVCRFKTYWVINLNDETFRMQSSSSTQGMNQLIGLLIQVNFMVICFFFL